MENFDKKCYELLKQVPKGKVTTYKAIAQKLGTKAYRAVGNAMNKNPFAPIVPCHRVVGSDGKLVGFAKGIEEKKKILQSEGIEIEDDKVDLKKYEWKFNL